MVKYSNYHAHTHARAPRLWPSSRYKYNTRYPRRATSLAKAYRYYAVRLAAYLVDGARDETRAIRRSSQGDREGGRERRGRLHRGKGLAADVVAVGEAENASDLVVGDQPGERVKMCSTNGIRNQTGAWGARMNEVGYAVPWKTLRRNNHDKTSTSTY